MSRHILVIPPGATILEQMCDRGINKHKLAELSGLPVETIELLLKGDTELTEAIAEALEKAFGVPAKFWINLEGIYRQEIEAIEKSQKGGCKQ